MPVVLPGFAGGDRTAIDLPASQEKLLEAVAQSGKPVIVVLQNGSALAVRWAKEHANAILEAWYPGEAGGTAIAETLAGDNNPAGRLPLTFYASLDQLPPFEKYAMQNRTYRYFTGEPLFRFGEGLSYTSFAYTGTTVVQKTVKAGDPVTVKAEVRNTGRTAGDEVAELYLLQPKGEGTPLLKLAGFQRVHLKPGESHQLSFVIDARSLSQVNGAGKRLVLPGEYRVAVGGSQPRGDQQPGMTFAVEGQVELPR